MERNTLKKTRLAIICGVSDYGPKYGNLPDVLKDMAILKDTLENKLHEDYCFQVEVYKDDALELPKMLRLLKRLEIDSPVNEVLFYLTGHGYVRQEDNTAFFVTYGSSTSCPGVALEEIIRALNSINTRKVFAVLDFCHSGAAIKGLTPVNNTNIHRNDSPSLAVLASTRENENAEAGKGKNLFFQAFIDSLFSSADEQGIVSWGRVGLSVCEKMRGSLYQRPVNYYNAFLEPVVINMITTGNRYIAEAGESKVNDRIVSNSQTQIFEQRVPKYYIKVDEFEVLKGEIISIKAESKSNVAIVVHGLPGSGKSTLIAALANTTEIQQKYSSGVFWMVLGQEPDVLPLIIKLIQKLDDHKFNTTCIKDASKHLQVLVKNKSILIVLDDAWHLEDVEPFLISNTSSQILITSRDALISKLIGGNLFTLKLLDKEQAKSLISGCLERGLMEDEVPHVESFLEAVGMLPLAVELGAKQIADNVKWDDLLKNLNEEVVNLQVLEHPGVEDIPEGRRKQFSLIASFNLSLKKLPQDKLKAFIWLGILPEDTQITTMMASILWDMNTFNTDRTLCYLSYKALLIANVQNSLDANSYYLHDLLHDHARALIAKRSTVSEREVPGLGLSIQDAHAEFLKKYRSLCTSNPHPLWQKLPKDGYIHSRLTWHMEKANWLEEMHGLLKEETNDEKNAWFFVMDGLGQFANYYLDIARAWRIARQSVKQRLEFFGSADNLGLEINYALVTSSLNSLAKNTPVSLLVALVEAKLWSETQALAYIRRNDFASAFTELRFYKSNELLNKALTEIVEERHDLLVIDLFTMIAPLLDSVLLDKALDIISSKLKDWHKGFIFNRLTPFLSEKQIERSLEIASSISSEEDKFRALKSILPSILKFKELSFTLNQIEGFKEDKCKIELQISLLPYLKHEQRVDLITQLYSSIMDLKNKKNRVSLLETLIPFLNESLLKEAILDIYKLENRQYQERLLSQLLPRLHEYNPKGDLLSIINLFIITEYKFETIKNFYSFLSISQIKEIFLEIQSNLSKEYQAKALEILAEVLPYDLLIQSLSIVDSIEDEKVRDNLVVRIFPHIARQKSKDVEILFEKYVWQLREENLIEVLKDVSPNLSQEHFDKIITTILPKISETKSFYSSPQAELITSIAPYLAKDLLDKLFSIIEELPSYALFPNSLSPKLASISSISPYLSGDLLLRAFSITQRIEDKGSQIKAIAKMSEHLSIDLLKYVYDQAVTIEGEYTRNECLENLAPHMTDSLMGNALIVAGNNSDGELFYSLAKYVPQSLLEKSFLIASSFSDEHYNGFPPKARALSVVSSRFADFKDFRKALSIAKQIAKDYYRDFAISDIVIKMAGEALFTDCLTTIEEISSVEVKSSSVAKVLAFLPGNYFKRIKNIINTLPESDISGCPKGYALLAFADRLETSEKVLVIDDVEVMVNSISSNYEKLISLERIVPEIARISNKYREALSIIGKMKDDSMVDHSSRAKALANIVSHLPSELLQDAFKLTRSIRDPYGKDRVLSKLVPRFAELGKLDLAFSEYKKLRYNNFQDSAALGLAVHLNELYLRKLWELIESNDNDFSRGKQLSALAKGLLNLPKGSLYPLISEKLSSLSTKKRSMFLATLEAIYPVIFKLGGRQAIKDTTDAILSVGKWWK